MATNATLYYPSSTAVDAANNLFIADSLDARIRKVDSGGIITTIAGNNGSGYFGDNVAATNTSLFDPLAVTVDAFGNLFIADTGNNRIRKVKSDGIITTVVGNGTPAYSGDGGAATNASLNHPVAVALDSGGNLFIADQANSRIRKANNTQWPTLVLDNLNPANAGNYQVVVTGPAGSVTSSVAALDVGMITSQPASRASQAGSTATFSVTVQGMPLLSYQWLKNGSNMTDGGNISGSTTATLTLTNVQNADGAPYSVVVSNSIAGCRTSSPALLTVIDIAAQPVGRSARPGNNVTFAVEVSGSGPLAYQWQLNGTNLPGGIITTVAGNGINGNSGDGDPATNASLSNPQGVAVDGFGNLLIADSGNNRIREISTSGIITTVAGTNGGPYFGDGGPAINAGLNQPTGAAVDASGNLFIADYGNNRIRQVDTDGIITTLAGTNISGFSGDGGTAINAQLFLPQSVAQDATGNLFIADTRNNRIRKIGADGIITTIAGTNASGFSGDGGPATIAKLSAPQGVTADVAGNLFIADTGNNRIRKISTNGIIATVAGTNSFGYAGDDGPSANAKLFHPTSVVVDDFGNLFIADSLNNRIRQVNSDGIITTVAGTSSSGFFGDGGPATNARLNKPYCIAVDASENLFIADTFNQRIRRVTSTKGPSLTLCNVDAANTGNYQLVVTGAGGSITSSVASLAVLLPPQGFTGQANNAGGSPQIALQFTGAPNYPYILQATTNLTPPVNWQPVLTNPADAYGNWLFTDTNLNGGQKFYRAVGQ